MTNTGGNRLRPTGAPKKKAPEPAPGWPVDQDFAEVNLRRMNEADQWPTTPVFGREDTEHSVNMPLGCTVWFHVRRLLWPDRSSDQAVKAHVLEMEAFPWGRSVVIRLDNGNVGRGEPAMIKVFVKDADGLNKVYEGQRGDELDGRNRK